MRYISFFIISLFLILSSVSCNEHKKYNNIFQAVRSGDVKAVESFIKKDPSLLTAKDNESKYKGIPLFVAIVEMSTPEGSKKVKIDMVETLIKLGTDVNYKDQNEESPLHIATAMGLKECTILLLSNGAKIEAASNTGWTPLFEAVMKGKYEIAKLLIEKGAKIDVIDNEGNTPLHSAAGWNRIDCAKLLIDKGANKDALNKVGRSPIFYAVQNDNIDIIKLLIEKGANINISDKDKETPLHIAAMWGKTDVAKILIEKGSKINSVDKAGCTPLDYSERNKSFESVSKLLKEHGGKKQQIK